MIPRLPDEFSNDRFRLLHTSPEGITTAGLRAAFELAFHVGEIDWPRTWHTEKVGNLRWVLVARNGHPLGPRPTAKAALSYPFVTPTYWGPDGLTTADDRCHVPLDARIRGAETSTAESAALMVFRTDNVSFVPEL